MSRENWYAKTQSKHSIDAEPRKGKFSDLTNDPCAKLYDEANEIFSTGVKLARSGDFDAAIPQIACAYLLDGRSINFTLVLPQNCNASQKNRLLDYEIVHKMIEYKPDEGSFGSSVLRIMLGSYMGGHPLYGQELIAAATVHIEFLLKYIEQHLEIEDRNSMVLGGCLTRTALLWLRSSLHMAMGNYKAATKDLTKALEIDEFYTQARESRACVWAAVKLKSYAIIFEEFKRIVDDHHEDNRSNEVSYAWLSLSILSDRSLGSLDEARGYYEKSIKATKRRDEIYGTRSDADLPDVVKQMTRRFHELQELQSNSALFGDLSALTLEDREKRKRSCLKCGATTTANGGDLNQCARCKRTYYCSRECQVEVGICRDSYVSI